MEITNETHTMEIVWHLQELCETHDWYFQMSDDPRTYEAGLVVADEINYLRSVLVARGYEQPTKTLIERYAPKQPASMSDLLKPHPGHALPRDVRKLMDEYKEAGLPGFPESDKYVERLKDMHYTLEQALGILEEAIAEVEAEENA